MEPSGDGNAHSSQHSAVDSDGKKTSHAGVDCKETYEATTSEEAKSGGAFFGSLFRLGNLLELFSHVSTTSETPEKETSVDQDFNVVDSECKRELVSYSLESACDSDFRSDAREHQPSSDCSKYKTLTKVDSESDMLNKACSVSDHSASESNGIIQSEIVTKAHVLNERNVHRDNVTDAFISSVNKTCINIQGYVDENQCVNSFKTPNDEQCVADIPLTLNISYKNEQRGSISENNSLKVSPSTCDNITDAVPEKANEIKTVQKPETNANDDFSNEAQICEERSYLETLPVDNSGDHTKLLDISVNNDDQSRLNDEQIGVAVFHQSSPRELETNNHDVTRKQTKQSKSSQEKIQVNEQGDTNKVGKHRTVGCNGIPPREAFVSRDESSQVRNAQAAQKAGSLKTNEAHYGSVLITPLQSYPKPEVNSETETAVYESHESGFGNETHVIENALSEDTLSGNKNRNCANLNVGNNNEIGINVKETGFVTADKVKLPVENSKSYKSDDVDKGSEFAKYENKDVVKSRCRNTSVAQKLSRESEIRTDYHDHTSAVEHNLKPPPEITRSSHTNDIESLTKGQSTQSPSHDLLHLKEPLPSGWQTNDIAAATTASIDACALDCAIQKESSRYDDDVKHTFQCTSDHCSNCCTQLTTRPPLLKGVNTHFDKHHVSPPSSINTRFKGDTEIIQAPVSVLTDTESGGGVFISKTDDPLRPFENAPGYLISIPQQSTDPDTVDRVTKSQKQDLNKDKVLIKSSDKNEHEVSIHVREAAFPISDKQSSDPSPELTASGDCISNSFSVSGKENRQCSVYSNRYRESLRNQNGQQEVIDSGEATHSNEACINYLHTCIDNRPAECNNSLNICNATEFSSANEDTVQEHATKLDPCPSNIHHKQLNDGLPLSQEHEGIISDVAEFPSLQTVYSGSDNDTFHTCSPNVTLNESEASDCAIESVEESNANLEVESNRNRDGKAGQHLNGVSGEAVEHHTFEHNLEYYSYWADNKDIDCSKMPERSECINNTEMLTVSVMDNSMVDSLIQSKDATISASLMKNSMKSSHKSCDLSPNGGPMDMISSMDENSDSGIQLGTKSDSLHSPDFSSLRESVGFPSGQDRQDDDTCSVYSNDSLDLSRSVKAEGTSLNDFARATNIKPMELNTAHDPECQDMEILPTRNRFKKSASCGQLKSATLGRDSDVNMEADLSNQDYMCITKTTQALDLGNIRALSPPRRIVFVEQGFKPFIEAKELTVQLNIERYECLPKTPDSTTSEVFLQLVPADYDRSPIRELFQDRFSKENECDDQSNDVIEHKTAQTEVLNTSHPIENFDKYSTPQTWDSFERDRQLKKNIDKADCDVIPSPIPSQTESNRMKEHSEPTSHRNPSGTDVQNVPNDNDRLESEDNQSENCTMPLSNCEVDRDSLCSDDSLCEDNLCCSEQDSIPDSPEYQSAVVQDLSEQIIDDSVSLKSKVAPCHFKDPIGNDMNSSTIEIEIEQGTKSHTTSSHLSDKGGLKVNSVPLNVDESLSNVNSTAVSTECDRLQQLFSRDSDLVTETVSPEVCEPNRDELKALKCNEHADQHDYRGEISNGIITSQLDNTHESDSLYVPNMNEQNPKVDDPSFEPDVSDTVNGIKHGYFEELFHSDSTSSQDNDLTPSHVIDSCQSNGHRSNKSHQSGGDGSTVMFDSLEEEQLIKMCDDVISTLSTQDIDTASANKMIMSDRSTSPDLRHMPDSVTYTMVESTEGFSDDLTDEVGEADKSLSHINLEDSLEDLSSSFQDGEDAKSLIMSTYFLSSIDGTAETPKADRHAFSDTSGRCLVDIPGIVDTSSPVDSDKERRHFDFDQIDGFDTRDDRDVPTRFSVAASSDRLSKFGFAIANPCDRQTADFNKHEINGNIEDSLNATPSQVNNNVDNSVFENSLENIDHLSDIQENESTGAISDNLEDSIEEINSNHIKVVSNGIIDNNNALQNSLHFMDEAPCDIDNLSATQRCSTPLETNTNNNNVAVLSNKSGILRSCLRRKSHSISTNSQDCECQSNVDLDTTSNSSLADDSITCSCSRTGEPQTEPSTETSPKRRVHFPEQIVSEAYEYSGSESDDEDAYGGATYDLLSHVYMQHYGAVDYCVQAPVGRAILADFDEDFTAF